MPGNENAPFFSIVIPCYNAEKTIQKTLKSVFQQTFNDYEVIIINDASNDHTKNLLNDYNKKYNNIIVIHNEENHGVAHSRNRAIEQAQGEYIAFLDSDDIWLKEKLHTQKIQIDRTNCDICCTSYSFINENDIEIKRPYIIPKNITYESMLKENSIGLSTAVVKKTLFNKYKMNNNFYHEDYSLWLRLLKHGAKVACVQDVLLKYRILKNSRSNNKFFSTIQRLKVYLIQEKIGILKSLLYLFSFALRGLRKHSPFSKKFY